MLHLVHQSNCLLNQPHLLSPEASRSGYWTTTGYVVALMFANICHPLVKDSSEAKARCVLKMSTDHTTMFISKQQSYLIASALPFPLWIILISFLKAHSAPLIYLKLQQNTKLQTVAGFSIQQKQRAVFCWYSFYKHCPCHEHFTDAWNPLMQLLLLSYDKMTCKANRDLLHLSRCSYLISTLAIRIFLLTWQAPHPSQSQRAGRDLPQAGHDRFQGSLATRTDPK